MQKNAETPDQFLKRVLPEEFVADLMVSLGHHIRESVFHPVMVVWLMMYQHLNGKKPLTDVLAEFQNGVGGVLAKPRAKVARVSSSTSALSQARTKLPEIVVEKTVDIVCEEICKSHKQQTWKGRNVYLLDGTSFRARAYADIAKDYPPSSDAERRSPWSTIRSCAAVNLMTGVALRPENGAMYGDNAAGEVGLGKKVIARLEPSSVIVADRGFGSFSIAYCGFSLGHDVVLRLTKAQTGQICAGKALKRDGELSVTWLPTKVVLRKNDEVPCDAEVPGRVIRYTSRRKGFRPTTLLIFTTLTLPVKEVVDLYRQRWNIETDFRSLKTSMKMEVLNVRSASMARKEIVLGFAAYNMVRHLLAFAARRAKMNVREISFKRFAYVVECVGARLSCATSNEEREFFIGNMLNVAGMRLPKRADRRSEPRKVIRKPQRFPYMKNTREEEREKLLLA